MTQKLINLSRRLVSLSGSSGQTWHIAPGKAVELPDFELVANAKLKKLIASHVLKQGSESTEQAISDGGGETGMDEDSEPRGQGKSGAKDKSEPRGQGKSGAKDKKVRPN